MAIEVCIVSIKRFIPLATSFALTAPSESASSELKILSASSVVPPLDWAKVSISLFEMSPLPSLSSVDVISEAISPAGGGGGGKEEVEMPEALASALPLDVLEVVSEPAPVLCWIIINSIIISELSELVPPDEAVDFDPELSRDWEELSTEKSEPVDDWDVPEELLEPSCFKIAQTLDVDEASIPLMDMKLNSSRGYFRECGSACPSWVTEIANGARH